MVEVFSTYHKAITEEKTTKFPDGPFLCLIDDNKKEPHSSGGRELWGNIFLGGFEKVISDLPVTTNR